MQMIDLKPHSTGMLLARWNTRWQFSNEQDYSSGKWDVQEITTVSADGQVEVRSEFAGPRGASTEPLHARTSGPSSVPVRRFPAPVESFLCPVPEFGDWQVFAPFLAQQGHEPVDAGLLRITSGQLVVSDPGWIGETPRTVAVPPGEFPVTLSLLRTARGAGVAAARVRPVRGRIPGPRCRR